MASKPFIGIDSSAAPTCRSAWFAPDHKLIGEAKRKTKAEEGTEAIIGRIVAGIEEACLAAKITLQDCGGVGIGCRAVDPRCRCRPRGGEPPLDNLPLADILAKRLRTKVHVDNDVNVVRSTAKTSSVRARTPRTFWASGWAPASAEPSILNGSLYYGHFMTAGEMDTPSSIRTTRAGSGRSSTTALAPASSIASCD
jgi:hypothetical protein